MKNTTTNNQTLGINIKLGEGYQNEFILDGQHSYHNLIPGNQIYPSTTDLNPEEHKFELYYPGVTPKQIKNAIPTGFNLITVMDPKDNTDLYAYSDLIKQILAFIGLAHHLKLINDQEAQTYLDKLSQIERDWFLLEPEDNDTGLDIDLDTIEIIKLKGIKTEDVYNITFNY